MTIEGPGGTGATGAGAAELTGGTSGDGGGGEGSEGGASGGAASEWLGTLPEELRGDATLSRYKDVEALARGHLEAHKVAKSKLAVPAADAGDDVWSGVWDALGRPKEAAGYGDFGLEALPEDAGDDAKTARETMLGGYREKLHEIGVPPKLANAIVAADIQRIADAETAYFGEGQKQIDALKLELGADYEPQKNAAKAMFTKIFGDEAAPIADELDRKVGSATLMKGMMKLARLGGEHGRIDGDGGELSGATNARAQIDAKMEDKSWRDKYNAGDPQTVAEYNKLLKQAQGDALAERRPRG